MSWMRWSVRYVLVVVLRERTSEVLYYIVGQRVGVVAWTGRTDFLIEFAKRLVMLNKGGSQLKN